MAALISKQKKELFVHEGCTFHFHKSLKKDPTIKFLDCSKKYSGCPVRLHTKNKVYSKQLNEHNHATDPAEVQVYQRVINGDERTNNVSEAAHRRTQRELCVEHPSIWRFIDALRTVQEGRDKVYEEYVRGDPATPKRRTRCR